jgi:uncharacterized membrane protein SpoIIM required for sporulation
MPTLEIPKISVNSGQSKSLALRSSDFRRERKQQWEALEELIEQAEKKGLRSLNNRQLFQLPALYRAAVSSLSVARSISLDQALLNYLEGLVARAYFCVYGVKPRPWAAIKQYLRQQLPQTFRSFWGAMLLVVLLLLFGIFLGLEVRDPELYNDIMPESLAQGRSPSSSTKELSKILYGGQEESDAGLIAFASFLFTHNAKVGILCFALGFALGGLPTLILVFYNGLMLGALAALYSSRGLALEFWAWVLPHGVTELLAVCLCAGAGMAISMSLIRAGRHSRRDQLIEAGRKAGLLVLGAVGLFFIAGLIEGIFRQRVHDIGLRYAMVAVSSVLWFLYFILQGRMKKQRRVS